MELFEQIKAIATEQNMDSILLQLKEINQAFNENNFLDLLVLGQFKAGKSSFINHILDKDILPTGVLPVTAIITRISHGNSFQSVVSYTNQSTEEITLQQLPAFISEKENPENGKDVSVVDLFIPEMKPFKPLRFVDTPGLGSVFVHNTLLTRNWLEKIKAAIVIISAVQPLSENDVTLIKEAFEQSPKVYILLSKIDLVVKEELEQITVFVKEKLKKSFKIDFELFPYSINGSGKELRQNIINNIFMPLALSSETVHHEVYLHKLNFLAQKTIGYLKINLKIAHQKGYERKQLELQIVDETLNLKYIKQELWQIGNSYKETTRDMLKNIFLKKHTNLLTNELSEELALQYVSWKGNLAKVTQQYEKLIRETMVKSIKKVELDEWNNISGHPHEAYNHFNSYLKSFRERLNQNIKTVLSIEMPAEAIEIKASPLQSPPIHISRTFDSHIDMLWFLIPMSVFRKSIKNHFLNDIPHEIEKNNYRLIAQLNDNINKIIDEMQQRAINYVSHELESLSLAITRQQSDENEIKQMITTLNNILNKM